MMKNIIKKASILSLSMVVAFSPLGKAVSFSDVSRTAPHNWAYDYIMEMAEKGIIKGHDDGTYKPGDDVRYLEITELLYEIMDPSAEEEKEANEKYSKLTDELAIPSWARKGLEVNLNRAIISEEDLRQAKAKGQLETGTQVMIDRTTVARLMAKALELDPVENPNLTYDDVDKISQEDAKIIGALQQTKILDPKGKDGNFAGADNIRRAEIAKMFKYAYDWVEKNPLSGGKTETVEGRLLTFLDGGTLNDLAIRTKDNKTLTIKVNDQTKITDIKNKEIKQADLAKYDRAELKVQYKTQGQDLIAISVVVDDTYRIGRNDVLEYVSTHKSDGKDYIRVRRPGQSQTIDLELGVNQAFDKNRRVDLGQIPAGTDLNLDVRDNKVVRIDYFYESNGKYLVKDLDTRNKRITLVDLGDSQRRNQVFTYIENPTVNRYGSDFKLEDIVSYTVDIQTTEMDKYDKHLANNITRIDVKKKYSEGTPSSESYRLESINSTANQIEVRSGNSRKWLNLETNYDLRENGSIRSRGLENRHIGRDITVKTNSDGRVYEIAIDSSTSSNRVNSTIKPNATIVEKPYYNMSTNETEVTFRIDNESIDRKIYTRGDSRNNYKVNDRVEAEKLDDKHYRLKWDELRTSR